MGDVIFLAVLNKKEKTKKVNKQLFDFVDVGAEQCHLMPVGRVAAQQNRIINENPRLKVFPKIIHDYAFNINDACFSNLKSVSTFLDNDYD